MSSDYVLSAEGLTKTFQGFTAVNSVNLKVREGSVHALIGPNGAGKTTLFNLLTKFLAPSAGRVLFRGKDVTGKHPADLSRLGLVRTFQISAIFPDMTALENVRVAMQRHEGRSHAFWRSVRTLKPLEGGCLRLLEEVGLEEFAQARAGTLSYGRKRALELATTLALKPDVLLLDEPMAGLGTEDVARISALIGKVAKGRTVVMVEHNMSVVADLSDWISVLQRGEILAEGDYETVSKDPGVIEAYIGSEN